MSNFSDELAESMAALRGLQDLLARVDRVLTTASVTVTTPDRRISVVVDGRGNLQALRFHSPGYRFMRAAKLSTVLTALCNQARAEIARQAAAAVGPVTAFGATVHEATIRAGQPGAPAEPPIGED